MSPRDFAPHSLKPLDANLVEVIVLKGRPSGIPSLFVKVQTISSTKYSQFSHSDHSS